MASRQEATSHETVYISRKSIAETENWLASSFTQLAESSKDADEPGWGADIPSAPAPRSPGSRRGSVVQRILRRLSFTGSRKREPVAPPKQSKPGESKAVLETSGAPCAAAGRPPAPPPLAVATEQVLVTPSPRSVNSGRRGSFFSRASSAWSASSGSSRFSLASRGGSGCAETDAGRGDWQEVTAEDGRIYYWNEVTDETTWVRPAALGGTEHAPAPAREHEVPAALEQQAREYREMQQKRMAAFKPLGRNRSSISLR